MRTVSLQVIDLAREILAGNPERFNELSREKYIDPHYYWLARERSASGDVAPSRVIDERRGVCTACKHNDRGLCSLSRRAIDATTCVAGDTCPVALFGSTPRVGAMSTHVSTNPFAEPVNTL